ncbi:MAG: UDP-2,3-diacylglucosamine diphosphatase LpxI [Deltaproteobacteria bacterium]|nr:UDP-2,3-diacylglucosamine diphosphatase LpxI [Deltaproteobacteria bacterium]MBW1812538.1 UDP-2,3-diacylglucosamine diphosphatase LpxI [Deltaproteobacteria bacterium]MBW1846060.1 UDP-2,3-diacylglucosamine diphosphatase LpxI [Deltaproteobacteria bacterium]MBW2180449.1 UDP-2,3-diacylglucosamine diphosphatase LpxI [Deltaproteobacteria bacterium]MBW2363719.1 UDP-2,3-diacylglucosamine diphosphatase LpxI [Deltaproteobacteria bacterium]
MRIGLIAGGGQFPIIFSKTARSKGYEVFAAAYYKETDPILAEYVDGIQWLYLGQVKRLLKYFKENSVNEAVMMGAVKKIRMFSNFRPDSKAISALAGIKHTHDDELLSAFARMLEEEGVKVRAATFLLPSLLAQEGCWTKKKPSKSEWNDIYLGWYLAKEIGRLDIGQCVVIAGGSVLSVEAIDGTDATIKRGGELGKGNAVVIKVCKPNQDQRFDIPAIGIQTIKTMHENGVNVLAIEAGKAVVFDRDEMISKANRYGISIVALKNDKMKEKASFY